MSTESLYIHIPFCDHICGYCAFTKFIYNRELSDAFLVRLLSQIHHLKGPYRTIYVGGGTPSSLQVDQLEALCQALEKKLARTYEFTFEANPETLEEEKLLILKKYGVNRISMGVQSSDNDILSFIGRHHRFYDVEKAVQLLKKHEIHNYSLDLMYGLPNQSIDSFRQSMLDVLSLNPPHLSIYALILEENSQFARMGIESVSQDLETEMYLMCIQLMKEHGYEHYEISNFAKPGYRSEHNQVYWRYEDFDALGPSAAMKNKNVRKKWTHHLSKYLYEDAFEECETLSLEDQMFEFIMMGLRLKDGINFKRFESRFNQSLYSVYKNAIDESIDEGLLCMNSERIYASEEGFVMLDDILIKFI